jgi:large subunit ribosomal protein L17
MRKRVIGKKFGRSHGHKKALKKNLLQALFLHGKITTTLPKAKYIKPLAERIITKARQDTPAHRQLLRSRLYDTSVVDKIFTEIAPQFVGRNGGYTRIVKLGKRQGDGSEMAVLEFVVKTAKGSSEQTEETTSAE